jgi:hypothetical protein
VGARRFHACWFLIVVVVGAIHLVHLLLLLFFFLLLFLNCEDGEGRSLLPFMTPFVNANMPDAVGLKTVLSLMPVGHKDKLYSDAVMLPVAVQCDINLAK